MVNGNELTVTNATGLSYTAKLGGTDAPVKGDPGVTEGNKSDKIDARKLADLLRTGMVRPSITENTD